MQAIDPSCRREPSPREIALAAAGFLAFYIAYFAPALFGGRLLAVGDAINQYFPALMTPAVWWARDLYAGFPAFADPQALVLSPLRLVGPHYNAAVLTVYVLIATGTYGYVRWLTQSRGAGLLAALIFGSCAPMIAHFGHLTIIYSVAWLPWTFWAIAAAAERHSVMAMAGGAVAIGLGIFGGHPQIYAYAMLAAAAYAAMLLVMAAKSLRGVLLVRYSLMFGLGVAIAAIQVLPLAELGARSLRTDFPFSEFVSYSLTPPELLMLVFPTLWNATGGFYLGTWGLAELSIACGGVAVLLAIAALVARRASRETWFFVALAVIALTFALGASTPLAKVVFHVPGLGRFRAPARAGFEAVFAIAVLAGMGYAALVSGRVDGARRVRYWLAVVALLVIIAGALSAVYPTLAARARDASAELPLIYANPAVLVPLAAMLFAAAAIARLQRRPSRVALATLALFVVVELGAFGWPYLRPSLPLESAVAMDPTWQTFAREVADARTRALFLDGNSTGGAVVRPNLGLLYGLPTAGAYGPLILANYATVMNVSTTGAVRSAGQLQERRQLGGVGWVIGGLTRQLPLPLGGDCTAAAGRSGATIVLQRPVRATHLEIISNMGCSVAVEQGTNVVDIGVEDEAGHMTQVHVVAGIDTAEWALDRADVVRSIRHRRPAHFTDFAAGDAIGHWYRSQVSLGGGAAVTVKRLVLRWMLPPGPGILITGLTLVDAATGERRPVSPWEVVLMPLVNPDSGDAKRALPRETWAAHSPDIRGIVWLVGDALPMADSDARAAIDSGRLPDGSPFDPYRTALVDPASSGMHAGALADAHATVREWSNGKLAIDVDAPRDAFLVVAESAYPGWRATLDGAAAPIVRTNVAFQGLRVAAGRHVVELHFVPVSLLRGLAIAVAGLALFVAGVLWLRRRESRVHRSASGLAEAAS